MQLLDLLRQHLSELDRDETGIEQRVIDELYRDVLATIERAEPARQSQLHARWLNRARLRRFAETMRVGTKLAFDTTVSWRDVVMDAVHDEADLPTRTWGSVARSAEVYRIIQSGRWDLVTTEPADEAVSIPDYSREVRLARARGDRRELTRLGAVFMELSGRDAVRWLLHVEAAQSTSPFDDWRVHTRSLAYMREHRNLTHIEHVELPDDGPWSWTAFVRLAQLGVLEEVRREVEYGRVIGFKLHDSELAIIDDVLADPPSPMALLARSMVAELTGGVLDPEAGHGTSGGRGSEYLAIARSLAHEVRNVLGPAQYAVGMIAKAVPAGDSNIEALVARVDKQFDRLFTFADQMMKLSELGRQRPRSFSLGVAIDEVLSDLAGEFNGRVTVLRPPSPDIELLGYADRFRYAVTDLVRNAARATVAPVRVTIVWSLISNDERVRMTVEDDGPGVSADLVESLFNPGVSGRGSSGYGLSIVRDVVERDLHGRIHYEPNTPVGSRFVMELPLPAKEPR